MRWAGATRLNITESSRRAFDGLPIGLYREGDDLLPIIIRREEENRINVAGSLDIVRVRQALSVETLPLSQVIEGISLQWEEVTLT